VFDENKQIHLLYICVYTNIVYIYLIITISYTTDKRLCYCLYCTLLDIRTWW